MRQHAGVFARAVVPVGSGQLAAHFHGIGGFGVEGIVKTAFQVIHADPDLGLHAFDGFNVFIGARMG